MIRIAVMLMVVLLAGCGNFQNVTVSDLRTPENQRAKGTLNMSILQIQTALYKYGTICRSLGSVDVDPSDAHRAQYTSYMPGLTKMSAATLVDFRQVGDHETRYTGYTYYRSAADLVTDVVSAIENPATCIN